MLELPLGNRADRLFRYANSLRCLVPVSIYSHPYDVILTSLLHTMSLLHYCVIAPWLRHCSAISQYLVYILEFYLGEPQLELT